MPLHVISKRLLVSSAAVSCINRAIPLRLTDIRYIRKAIPDWRWFLQPCHKRIHSRGTAEADRFRLTTVLNQSMSFPDASDNTTLSLIKFCTLLPDPIAMGTRQRPDKRHQTFSFYALFYAYAGGGLASTTVVLPFFLREPISKEPASLCWCRPGAIQGSA